MDLSYEAGKLVELHQPIAFLVVRLQHAHRLALVHVDAQPTQRSTQLLVVELTRVVGVEAPEGCTDVAVAPASLSSAGRLLTTVLARAARLQPTELGRKLHELG